MCGAGGPADDFGDFGNLILLDDAFRDGLHKISGVVKAVGWLSMTSFEARFTVSLSTSRIVVS